MDIIIVIVLLLIGLLLILAEIFLLPGITFAAIGGAIFGIGGVGYAYSAFGTIGGTITLVCALLIFGISFVWLIKSRALDKIALKTDIGSTIADKTHSDSIKEGDKAITISRLNPIGKVKIGHTIAEAKTLDGFTDEGIEVYVIKVNPTQLIVQEVEHKEI